MGDNARAWIMREVSGATTNHANTAPNRDDAKAQRTGVRNNDERRTVVDRNWRIPAHRRRELEW
jgi:hypothetical protein